MEITVIHDDDHVGWAAGATRVGEIYMTDVQSMVDNVLTEAGGSSSSRLNILDHGNSSGIEISAAAPTWAATASSGRVPDPSCDIRSRGRDYLPAAVP